MSAVAGLWRFDNKPDPGADCLRMLAAQDIYGPHDSRMWTSGSIAMGRCLFRTLPEDAHDRQPLHSRDGRLVLVADVRIDNRDELIAALGRTQANTPTMTQADTAQLCDAAMLLACLERWGDGALDRVVGDFAFALWDARAQAVMLARDFRGHVPLHYHRGRDFFAFASMPKGLHALAGIPRAPDEDAVASFIAAIPDLTSRSYFASIERVRPAHVVTVTRDGVSHRCYWQPRRPEPTHRSTADYVEGLRFHLDQATQSRLLGVDGIVGAHLSAGLDSSGVTATAARLLAPRGGKVVAFTAVPGEKFVQAEGLRYITNEGPLAAATAALYGNIEHVLIRSGHLSPLAGLDRSVFLCERPILAPSNWVWSSAINEAARVRNITIVLTGQMGNLGMSYNGLQLLPELLRHGRLLRLWHETSQLVSEDEMNWRGAASIAFGPFAPAWLWQTLRQFMRAPMTRRPRSDSFDGRRAAIGRGDIGTYNKAALAGWGIDLRDPTADRRLVEYCLSVPAGQYLNGGVPRALARRALADRLPDVVLNERRKGFQAADWHAGLTAARSEVIDELKRLAACAPAARLLDIGRLQALADHWPESGWERDDIVRTYRLKLLRGISAGHFLRKTREQEQ